MPTDLRLSLVGIAHPSIGSVARASCPCETSASKAVPINQWPGHAGRVDKPPALLVEAGKARVKSISGSTSLL